MKENKEVVDVDIFRLDGEKQGYVRGDMAIDLELELDNWGIRYPTSIDINYSLRYQRMSFWRKGMIGFGLTERLGRAVSRQCPSCRRPGSSSVQR